MGCENEVLKVPIRIALSLVTPPAPGYLLVLSPRLLRGPSLGRSLSQGTLAQVGDVWLGTAAQGKRELLFLFFYSGNVFPPVIHQILLEFNTHQL